MKSIPIIAFLIITSFSFSQTHIKGNVTLDIEKGYIKCEFTLTNLPKLKKYKILLNHGMNIKYFKDDDKLIPYKGYYDGKTQGEALEYELVDKNNVQIPLPEKVIIEYSGAFPVYKDSLNLFDFKGYIAVNNKTIRATEQTKWYPVIYDIENDKLIQDYTYDITFTNLKPISFFINNNAPKKGKKVHFISTKTAPLFIFLGDYNYINSNGNYLINTNVNTKTAHKFFSNLALIKNFYTQLFGFSFTDKTYIINFKAVKNMRNSSWAFNVYPSFGFTNLDFDTLFTSKNVFKENKYKFFAHELAHNFFGNNVNSGKLSWFWLESTAEYLSLIALENYTSISNVTGYYEYYINSIENKTFIPLNDIDNKNQISGIYRYQYGTLILKSFELSFGKEKTILVLKTILKKSKLETLTILSWRDASLENGISNSEFTSFKNTFLSDKKAKKNTIKFIRKELKINIKKINKQ